MFADRTSSTVSKAVGDLTARNRMLLFQIYHRKQIHCLHDILRQFRGFCSNTGAIASEWKFTHVSNQCFLNCGQHAALQFDSRGPKVLFRWFFFRKKTGSRLTVRTLHKIFSWQFCGTIAAVQPESVIHLLAQAYIFNMVKTEKQQWSLLRRKQVDYFHWTNGTSVV